MDCGPSPPTEAALKNQISSGTLKTITGGSNIYLWFRIEEITLKELPD